MRNVSASLTLRTLDELGQGSNLTVDLDNLTASASVIVTFNLTDPEYATGQLVEIAATRSASADLAVLLWRLDTNGNPILQGQPFDWRASLGPVVNFTHPNGRLLDDRDTGQYVLTVWSRTLSTTLAYTRVGVNADSSFPIGTSILADITTQSALVTSTQQAETLAAEKTVTDHWLTATAWVYADNLLFFDRAGVNIGMPNGILAPLVFLGLALVLRFARRS